jgi:hypothetical protein
VLEEVELLDQHVASVLRLEPTGESEPIPMAESIGALPRFVTEGRYVDVDNSRLRAAASFTPLNGQSHPALVRAGTIRAQLGVGRQLAYEAHAVHADNTVGL